MTVAEIDRVVKVAIKYKKAGQFRAYWANFNESVNLMASKEVVVESMWSPAVAAVRSKGIACTFQPLKEGYRAWAAGFGVPKTVTGKKADAVYEFINWFLDGWAGAYLNRQGPGMTCYTTATGGGCDGHLNPLPWLVLGVIFFVAGVVLHARQTD